MESNGINLTENTHIIDAEFANTILDIGQNLLVESLGGGINCFRLCPVHVRPEREEISRKEEGIAKQAFLNIEDKLWPF